MHQIAQVNAAGKFIERKKRVRIDKIYGCLDFFLKFLKSGY